MTYLDTLISNGSIVSSVKQATHELNAFKTEQFQMPTTFETEKFAEAINALNQQNSFIVGLRSAHLNTVKIAASLVEATKLAQDGVIDVRDIFETAKELMAKGNVKLSSVNEMFDETPGDVISGPELPESQQLDPLTQALRNVRS